jgi:putative endonuclease
MRYVYLLQSLSQPEERYTGSTDDFKQRLADHNAGRSTHTNKFKPWEPIVVIRFNDDRKADAFEKYLKSGSGHAFARRHFW